MRKAVCGAAWLGVVLLSCDPAPISTLAEGGPGAGSRIPSSHRAAGAVCPQPRGPGALDTSCAYEAGAPGGCRSDADCTAGKNGRCLPTPGVSCAPQCSYDTCFADGDCGGTPCQCRASPSDSAANVCLPGNCTLDSDCGQGGFCSPSGLSDACGLGYYCHTPNDSCTSSSDCPSSEGCNFDSHVLAWSCSATCTVHP